MHSNTPLAVQLPAELAAALVATGDAIPIDEHVTDSRGAIPELAQYVALFAGVGAAVVTLLDAPRVMRSVARSLVRHRHGCPVWLHAEGPGGELRLEMTTALDEEVVAGVLHALWQVDVPDEASQASLTGRGE